MEYRQGPYIHQEQVRHINMNIEETNSNGHRKRMESLEPVKTIRMLKFQEKKNYLTTQ